MLSEGPITAHDGVNGVVLSAGLETPLGPGVKATNTNANLDGPNTNYYRGLIYTEGP